MSKLAQNAASGTKKTRIVDPVPPAPVIDGQLDVAIQTARTHVADLKDALGGVFAAKTYAREPLENEDVMFALSLVHELGSALDEAVRTAEAQP